MATVDKFGVGNDMTDAGEIIWTRHGQVGESPQVSAVGTLTMSSTSTSDAAAGTGAREVLISGIYCSDGTLDSAAEGSVTLATNGTSTVTDVSPGGWYRVYRAKVTDSGSGEVNAGRLDFEIGGQVVASIDIGIGQTEMAFWSSIYEASMDWMDLILLKSSGQSPSGIVKPWCQPWGGPKRVFAQPMAFEGDSGQWRIDYGPEGPTIPARSDAWMEVFEITGTATLVGGFRVIY